MAIAPIKTDTDGRVALAEILAADYPLQGKAA